MLGFGHQGRLPLGLLLLRSKPVVVSSRRSGGCVGSASERSQAEAAPSPSPTEPGSLQGGVGRFQAFVPQAVSTLCLSRFSGAGHALEQ